MQVEQLIREIAARFDAADLSYGHGTDNAVDEAAWLVFATLGLSQDDAQAAYATEADESSAAAACALAERRVSERIPLAYLLNEAWFCGWPFYVDERVLVPRSPFAELIRDRFEPWLGGVDVKRAVDLGTGIVLAETGVLLDGRFTERGPEQLGGQHPSSPPQAAISLEPASWHPPIYHGDI